MDFGAIERGGSRGLAVRSLYCSSQRRSTPWKVGGNRMRAYRAFAWPFLRLNLPAYSLDGRFCCILVWAQRATMVAGKLQPASRSLGRRRLPNHCATQLRRSLLIKLYKIPAVAGYYLTRRKYGVVTGLMGGLDSMATSMPNSSPSVTLKNLGRAGSPHGPEALSRRILRYESRRNEKCRVIAIIEGGR